MKIVSIALTFHVCICLVLSQSPEAIAGSSEPDLSAKHVDEPPPPPPQPGAPAATTSSMPVISSAPGRIAPFIHPDIALNVSLIVKTAVKAIIDEYNAREDEIRNKYRKLVKIWVLSNSTLSDVRVVELGRSGLPRFLAPVGGSHDGFQAHITPQLEAATQEVLANEKAFSIDSPHLFGPSTASMHRTAGQPAETAISQSRSLDIGSLINSEHLDKLKSGKRQIQITTYWNATISKILVFNASDASQSHLGSGKGDVGATLNEFPKDPEEGFKITMLPRPLKKVNLGQYEGARNITQLKEKIFEAMPEPDGA